MTSDLAPFIETFYEESVEGLDLIETSLLSLENGDGEAIHSIFRAAHSIKGGAATFGFTAIAEFTHGVETLLDRMREGTHGVDGDVIALLLEASDCIRNLLASARDDGELDAERVASVGARVEAELVRSPGADDAAPAVGAEAARTGPVSATGWRIGFAPEPDFFARGHDAVAMFRALAGLGELAATVDASAVPSIEALEAEHCHLRWDLELRGTCARADVAEIFEWVESECALTIEPLPTEDDLDRAPEATQEAGADDPAPAPVSADEAAVVEEQGARRAPAESSSIRVATTKIDQLINMVGELVITQSMLTQVGEELDEFAESRHLDRLREGLGQLERNTRELQESIMAIRMVPVSFAFNRFPRLVRDASARLGKRIELVIEGEQTEMDKTLIEKIGDPLTHLVRNAIDHGIEPPAERLAAGKAETGTVRLEAGHKGGSVVIEIHDDGRGLDSGKILSKARERGLVGADADLSEAQVFDLVFAPGFSTADQVSDMSGRGVGMDVVRRNILALGGEVEMRSRAGEGTTVRIVLPLTLAILDGQAVRVGEELYVIPLVSILESICVRDADIRRPAGAVELLHWRDEHLPLLRLDSVLETAPSIDHESRGLVVVAEGGGFRAGLAVDDLLAQQQVVIKSLEDNFTRVDGISGATILGDGSVALILDVAGVIKLADRASGRTPKRSLEPSE